MKKLLVIAVALASVNAFATRARLSSLNNSVHLIDTYTVFTNPADMFSVGGDYVTLESGNSSLGVAPTAGGTDAEGMVVRSMGDAKMGLALGHDSALGVQLRSLATAAFPTRVNYFQQNPLELSYGMKAGDLAWGATLIYSNYASKTAPNEKENTLGARFGMRTGSMDFNVGLGLANNYQNDTDGKFTGTLGLTGAFGMWLDTVYLNAKVQTAGFKTENAAGTETSKVSGNVITLTAIDSRKKDGNEFFYGAGLTSYMSKDSVADSKVNNLTLPVTIGLEQKANTWLTLRGSVTETVLINNTKSESATSTISEFAPGANNTSVAIGAGLNFDKVTLDGTLRGLSTSSVATGSTANQQLDGNTLLGQVGLTYMF